MKLPLLYFLIATIDLRLKIYSYKIEYYCCLLATHTHVCSTSVPFELFSIISVSFSLFTFIYASIYNGIVCIVLNTTVWPSCKFRIQFVHFLNETTYEYLIYSYTKSDKCKAREFEKQQNSNRKVLRFEHKSWCFSENECCCYDGNMLISLHVPYHIRTHKKYTKKNCVYQTKLGFS